MLGGPHGTRFGASKSPKVDVAYVKCETNAFAVCLSCWFQVLKSLACLIIVLVK